MGATPLARQLVLKYGRVVLCAWLGIEDFGDLRLQQRDRVIPCTNLFRLCIRQKALQGEANYPGGRVTQHGKSVRPSVGTARVADRPVGYPVVRVVDAGAAQR